MRSTRRIQRLKQPSGRTNPFSFGGGLVNGGFSDVGMDILSKVFSFDYMGSAEFEFGALPAALLFLLKQGEDQQLVAGKHGQVFYISPIVYENEVKKRLDQLIANERELYLCEWCGLANSLNQPIDAYKTVGWIELDNGFMFFVDEQMFNKAKNLFGALKSYNTSP